MASFVSLDSVRPGSMGRVVGSVHREAPLQQSIDLNRFLAGVERRAFRIAEIALHDREDALDVVQVAMLRLAQSYGQRPSEEWRPLFYRILYNAIRDCQRRRAVRAKRFGWVTGWRTDDEGEADAPDPLARVADGAPDPSQRVMAGEAMDRLRGALESLSVRQQEAFVLRCLEGMDVAGTAAVMGCSEGSVKTHYFRALQVLRERLGEVW